MSFRKLTVPFADPDQIDDATEVYGEPRTLPVARLVDVAHARTPRGRTPWRVVPGLRGLAAVLDADGDTVITCCRPEIAKQIVEAVNK